MIEQPQPRPYRGRGRNGLPGALGLAILQSGEFLESLRDAMRTRDPHALVDGERLPQMRRSFTEAASLHVTEAESFQSTRFLRHRSDITGNDQSLGMQLSRPGGRFGDFGRAPDNIV